MLPRLLRRHPTLQLLPLCGFLFACQGTRPQNLGYSSGSLISCPSSPNCVSSGTSDAEHRIDAFPVAGSGRDSMEILDQVISAMPRMTRIEKNAQYMRYEAESRLLHFVDDLEFYLAPASEKIEVRSASRLGQSDLGVNRKRVEEIRQEYTKALAK